MRLDHALSELEFIRARIAGAERVVCFRWATTLSVGGLAVVAGGLQSMFVTQPVDRPLEYFFYWAFVAFAAICLTGGEIGYRYLILATHLERRQTRLALADFAPAVAIGGVISLLLVVNSPDFSPLLPTLWMSCFSLGVFAMRARLPGALWVAVFFAIAAMVAVRSIETPYALSGWLMGVSFGVGHILLASLLYFDVMEKSHES